ncbi:hypothetical protein LSTR_LSTR006226 [Laodelphax striatellus]|uniref:Uncharacterized protein n=1 Tax=Laodelphax striatellus TaxID=195883 RepID=A0A482XS32_LAOST|nr:hypothetical protein LSTR_LSTR006226 [Laodelphax striatellus]
MVSCNGVNDLPSVAPPLTEGMRQPFQKHPLPASCRLACVWPSGWPGTWESSSTPQAAQFPLLKSSAITGFSPDS